MLTVTWACAGEKLVVCQALLDAYTRAQNALTDDERDEFGARIREKLDRFSALVEAARFEVVAEEAGNCCRLAPGGIA
ncbi:hypothetical protein LYSHEL_28460 [Lysobacter helvus]|uniref:Uncharacterized protein n=2 Tax=Lysobacteraceae TaxID=32033 RepID=A0ABN6FWK0_9GAMM|nr:MULTISPECIES: hypothetical protein [Lysobacter]BCT93819.1 hypothetical protein LYSCAS_28430 [Lysobacter caseinilyticus]BCT96975.1 hypothetical protein LYSHEL_28460 [Lysobacter helvus]